MAEDDEIDSVDDSEDNSGYDEDEGLDLVDESDHEEEYEEAGYYDSPYEEDTNDGELPTDGDDEYY